MKKNQFVFGWILLVISLMFVGYLGAGSEKVGLFGITGLAIGYVMQRSRFGFAGIVRKMYKMGNSDLPKAVMFLLAISVVASASLQYYGHTKGITIPGMSSVKTISMLTVIGAFIFGIGMMFAGGCASGTLTDLGEGYVRAAITLLFFCLGSVLGVAHLDTLKPSVLGKGFKYYFPDHFGYFWSLVIFLTFYGVLYLLVTKYEATRKAKGTYIKEEYQDWEKSHEIKPDYKIFSTETYHNLFVKRWSFYTGGALLSILFITMVASTGKNWGVTTEFAYWGGRMLKFMGMESYVNSIGFFQSEKVVNIMNHGVLDNAASVRNIGIIFGTIIASLLAGGLTITKDMNLRKIVAYILGGLFMGYGARLASGCNIGAFYSALSQMSLSGIVFGGFLILGGIVGLKLSDKFDI